jgi:SepF-like predicted cell division protein (DUF552 family)
MRGLLIGTAIVVGIPVGTSAYANWWIVRSSDGKCLVVDIEPTDKDKGVIRVGKDTYQTAEQAGADAKRVCKDAKAEGQPVPPSKKH